MQEQTNHSELGKVVYDYTLKQFAILKRVYRENKFSVWMYVLEYADNKTRERFYSEILIKPVFHAIIES